ncbi:MAG: hypothetical protein RLZZ387_3824 [Chloroflexota bacterium]|jgi:ADP-heptose:LPS heptosyltransferase
MTDQSTQATAGLTNQASLLEARTIVVYRSLFLGDLICALPALQALRARFPEAQVTLIGLPWTEDFVRRAPAIDRLLHFPGYPGIREVSHDQARTEAFLQEARAARYDLAIQMHGDGTVSNGFVAELGARFTLGYRRGDDARLTHSLPYQDGEHEAGRWLRLVGELGADATPTPPQLTVTPYDHSRARPMLGGLSPRSGPLVGLHVGAKDPARRWPSEKFAALADALHRRCGARVVLTGGEAERAITQSVVRAVRFPVLDLAGATDLGTFAALLHRLDLLVTNDTGASHLASITRTPSVVLFGPSRPAQWAPLDSERHRAIDALALAGEGADPSAALRALPTATVLATCEDVFLSRGNRRPATDDRRPATDETGLAREIGGRSSVVGGR